MHIFHDKKDLFHFLVWFQTELFYLPVSSRAQRHANAIHLYLSIICQWWLMTVKESSPRNRNDSNPQVEVEWGRVVADVYCCSDVLLVIPLLWCVFCWTFVLSCCFMPDNYNKPYQFFLTDLFTFLQPRLSNPALVRLSNSFGSPLLNGRDVFSCSYRVACSRLHVSLSMCALCFHHCHSHVPPPSCQPGGGVY